MSQWLRRTKKGFELNDFKHDTIPCALDLKYAANLRLKFIDTQNSTVKPREQLLEPNSEKRGASERNQRWLAIKKRKLAY